LPPGGYAVGVKTLSVVGDRPGAESVRQTAEKKFPARKRFPAKA